MNTIEISDKLKSAACKADILAIFEEILSLITIKFAIINKKKLKPLIFEILMVSEPYWKHTNIAKNVFNFVQFMCFEDDCRNEFRPFIMDLINLIISHSDNDVIRAGFDAFAKLSVCSNTAYWFNSSVFKLCEIISSRPAFPNIIKSGIAMLNCFAHNAENRILLSSYIPRLSGILYVYSTNNYIAIELLKLFRILGNGHQFSYVLMLEESIETLLLIFEQNNNAAATSIATSTELNEYIISIFCILAKRSHRCKPTKFIRIIPTLFTIAGNKQVSARVVQSILELFSCISQYDQPCRDFMHRYSLQLLDIMCITQNHINSAARINLLGYRSTMLQCCKVAGSNVAGSKVIKSTTIHNILHRSKAHWTMHISAFLSEDIAEDTIECIVLNGLKTIHFIHINNDWGVLIPHLSKLLYIIASYKENVDIGIFMFLFINNFINNDGVIIWSNVALLTKHINLLKKIAKHLLYKNINKHYIIFRESIRAVISKIIMANSIKKFMLK